MWCSVGASQAQCWWKASNFFHRNEKWIEMRAHTEWAILFSKMIKHTKAPTKFRSHIIPLLAKEWALGFLLGTRSVNLQVLGSRDCGGGFNTLVSCKSERFMRWWWKLPACSHPPSTSPLFLEKRNLRAHSLAKSGMIWPILTENPPSPVQQSEMAQKLTFPDQADLGTFFGFEIRRAR